MEPPSTVPSVSRRAALAGLGAGGLGLAVAVRNASVQAAKPNAKANHRIVGSWMVLNTPPNVGMFFSDGSILNVAISNSVGPDQRVGLASPGAGTWDVIDEHAVHVTFVEFLTDADGTLTGILAFEGYPVLNEDEQTWLDDGSKTKVTFLDASYNIIRVIGGDGSLGSVTANRMGPGVFGLPKATPPAPASATPTS